MQTVKVKLAQRSYPVHIGANSLAQSGQLLHGAGLRGKVLILSNKKVFRLYGKKLQANLAKHYQVYTYLTGEGEKYKSFGELQKVLRFLIQNKFERLDTIVGFGGGIVGDLAGFAAAVFLRGINLVQIPTTLLAQVDSSIGGKTAVNDRLGKNLIGAFYQPKLVIADTNTLRTLPARELRCGLGEIVKYGLIAQPKILAILEKKQNITADLIAQCCRIKAQIVSADEREKNLRAVLNFGHTIGHALETVSRYRISHGEAIALGALCAVHISVMRGLVPDNMLNRLQKLYLKLKLPVHTGRRLNPEQIYRIMQNDKKVSAGRLCMVLLKDIGKPVVCPVEYDEIEGALNII